jgi:hypothetical protein
MMKRIKEAAYTVTDEQGEAASKSVLVERVGSGTKLPSAHELAQDMGIAGREAFMESGWLGTVARDTAIPRERLASRAFPQFSHLRADRITDLYAGGPVTYWTAATFRNSRDEVGPNTVRTGFMTTETHVRGPRMLQPLLRRIGRFVTVNVTELVVRPDSQRSGIARALADAALRDVPGSARVRFSAPEGSVVHTWAEAHEIHPYVTTLVPRDESPVGERVWMAQYDRSAEQVQAGLRANNPWLAAGTVERG